MASQYHAVGRPGGRRYWVTGIFAALVALAALVAGSAFGNVREHSLDPKLIAWMSALAVLVFGVLATARVSAGLARLAGLRAAPAIEGAVRVLSAGVGALIVVFSVLAVLDVSIEHLLVGAGLAGIILGIAAQQSLGNVFAGLVLILVKPFTLGDHVRIRSGALGGIFDAWILEMSLTYVTLRTDDGVLKIPNSAMLAAGVGHLPAVTDSGAAPGSGSSSGARSLRRSRSQAPEPPSAR